MFNGLFLYDTLNMKLESEIIRFYVGKIKTKADIKHPWGLHRMFKISNIKFKNLKVGVL